MNYHPEYKHNRCTEIIFIVTVAYSRVLLSFYYWECIIFNYTICHCRSQAAVYLVYLSQDVRRPFLFSAFDHTAVCMHSRKDCEFEYTIEGLPPAADRVRGSDDIPLTELHPLNKRMRRVRNVSRGPLCEDRGNLYFLIST